MLQVKSFQFNMFGENTYVVFEPVSRQAAVVDPGMLTDDDHAKVAELIAAEGLDVKYILQTHLHIDHAFGTAVLAGRLDLTPMAHRGDFFLGGQLAGQAQMFGVPMETVKTPVSFVPLEDGQQLKLGTDTLEVVHVPGHSPGGVAFYSPTSHLLFTGDTLFDGNVGRTDLPGGSYSELMQSVKRLMSFPSDTVCYPGHGGEFLLNK